MELLRSMRMPLLTKEKKVATADITGYDFETQKITAIVNGKKAEMPKEDISIYQKQNNEFASILGANLNVYVIKYNRKTDTYEISRKKYMEKELEKYKKGDTVNATIVSASDRALYLEFGGGLSGIMYLNELTSSKVRKPLDIYSIGDTIRCKIIQKDGNLFKLSRVSLYKNVNLNIKTGDKVRCRITKRLDDNSGYFVEVVQNPLYSGIFDVRSGGESFKLGENITLRIIGVKNKHLKLRTV